MDDDWDDLPEVVHHRPSRRLSWQNVAAVILSGASAILEDVASIPEALATLLMADGNYAEDRTAFHQEAALEIETLMQEE